MVHRLLFNGKRWFGALKRKFYLIDTEFSALSNFLMPYLYTFSLLPAFLTIYGNLHGGVWAAANTVFIFVFLVILEFFNPIIKSSSPNKNQDFIPTLIIILHPVAHTLGVISLLYGVYAQTLQGAWLGFAVFSTGLNSGVSGIIAAHELIHRREKWARFLGVWNLWLVNYSHYYVEHVRVHHRYVATALDAATAFKNESLYKFYLRTIPSQWRSAFKADRKFVINMSLIQLLTNILIGSFLGPIFIAVYLGNSLTAILLLEYANYIEHYALVRQDGEPIRAHHSWQNDSIVTRTILMELSRHSDHHLRASKPYQKLDSVAGTPTAPFGYFGMFFIAAMPPLWFKIMNPIIDNKVWEKGAS